VGSERDGNCARTHGTRSPFSKSFVFRSVDSRAVAPLISARSAGHVEHVTEWKHDSANLLAPVTTSPLIGAFSNILFSRTRV